MRKFCAVIVSLLLAGCVSSPEEARPRLAVFGSSLVDAAKEIGVSVSDMASLAKSWGYDGVELWVGRDEDHAEEFVAAGLEPSAVIVTADFAVSTSLDKASAAIGLAKRYGCRRIMVIPGFLENGVKREVVWPAVVRNFKVFLQACATKGFEVVIEDFGQDKVLIGSAEHLRKAIADIPGVGIAFDTGNFENWGEDALAASREFLPHIRHVHMKDLAAYTPKPVVLGTGRLPVREIYDLIRRGGYRGWFTVECFGADDLCTVMRKSAKFFAK